MVPYHPSFTRKGLSTPSLPLVIAWKRRALTCSTMVPSGRRCATSVGMPVSSSSCEGMANVDLVVGERLAKHSILNAWSGCLLLATHSICVLVTQVFATVESAPPNTAPQACSGQQRQAAPALTRVGRQAGWSAAACLGRSRQPAPPAPAAGTPGLQGPVAPPRQVPGASRVGGAAAAAVRV